MRGPDGLFPARLKRSEKRTLDLIGDSPWIAPHHLASPLGVARRRVSQLTAGPEQHDLLSAHGTERMRRLVLIDRGLALLAHRAPTAAVMSRKRWSASLLDPKEPFQWRNLRSRQTRQLLRNLTHAEVVHGFLAALADQASSTGWELTQIDPPKRASRCSR